MKGRLQGPRSKGPRLNCEMIDDLEAAAAQRCADKFGVPGFDDPEGLFIGQRYDGYTEENQQTWRELYERQIQLLSTHASATFMAGAHAIQLAPEHIPQLDRVSARLRPLTGWQSRPVPGYLPSRAFFACLARRTFPTTIVIRPSDSLDYLPEPDIFHDVFGHVPLHADSAFAEFLQTYGRAALCTHDSSQIERLARLFWFTVEFGLIQERGEIRLYGSGLISSPAEALHALESDEVQRRPFELEEVCETDFEIDHFQPILFVLDDFEQLQRAMTDYASTLIDS